MSFKTLIESSYEEYEFNKPVNEVKLNGLIHQVGALPKELIELLRETDGARIGDMVSLFSVEDHGGETFDQIIEEWADPEYPEMYPNASDLLFFASDGMGGFFGYKKLANGEFGDIYHWDHEEDELQNVAETGLAGFIKTCEEYPD